MQSNPRTLVNLLVFRRRSLTVAQLSKLTWQLLGDSLERARAHAAEGSIILDSGRGAALC